MTPRDSSVEIGNLKASLAAFAERLHAAVGEELISVVLFGGAARGNFDPQISDVNVMLVLRSVSIAILDHIEAAAEPVRRECALSLLTVTEEDLGDSAELFPTKFLDIERNHETLWGRPVAASLAVPHDRLKRQARRELMNLHLRLRQVYLDSSRRPEQLDGMMRRSVTALWLNLGLLLELRLGRPCDEKEAILAAAAEVGLDRAVLAKLAALKSARESLPVAELKPHYEEFMRQVAAVIRMADEG